MPDPQPLTGVTMILAVPVPTVAVMEFVVLVPLQPVPVIVQV